MGFEISGFKGLKTRVLAWDRLGRSFWGAFDYRIQAM